MAVGRLGQLNREPNVETRIIFRSVPPMVGGRHDIRKEFVMGRGIYIGTGTLIIIILVVVFLL